MTDPGPWPRGWPVDSDWTPILADVLTSQPFRELMRFVALERSVQPVYPPAEDVFHAFRRSAFAMTKVVILGQDPYHGPGQANGLAFSVRSGCTLPPSLRNIFAELDQDLGIDNRPLGDLTAWAEQGVMLLNTVLTVRQGQAHSHRQRGWEPFTDRVIATLGTRQKPAVFLLWGKPAATRARWIGGHHTVLTAAHPSPLSAYRGFHGCQHFSRANQALIAAGQAPVDWQLPLDRHE